jgi:hypothetical protein
VKRLEGYGLENVHLEKWGPFGRSWSLKQASLEMLEPRYAALDEAPSRASLCSHPSGTVARRRTRTSRRRIGTSTWPPGKVS